MNQKKIPERTCIVCRNKGAKENFVRMAKTKDGKFIYDETGKLGGRGVYICKNGNCFDNLQKTKALSRIFKTQISSETYEEILSARANKQN